MTELKHGTLIATNRKFGTGVELHRIVRDTATTYVCDTGVRFRKDDLKIVGADRFGPFSGRTPSSADILSARIRAAQEAIKRLVVTEENLERVEAAIRT